MYARVKTLFTWKKEVLKTSREKPQITHKGKTIRLTANFSMEI